MFTYAGSFEQAAGRRSWRSLHQSDYGVHCQARLGRNLALSLFYCQAQLGGSRALPAVGQAFSLTYNLPAKKQPPIR